MSKEPVVNGKLGRKNQNGCFLMSHVTTAVIDRNRKEKVS